MRRARSPAPGPQPVIGRRLAGVSRLPDGVKDYDDGVYLELANATDGLDSLAARSASAIRAITDYDTNRHFESSASRQHHIGTGHYLHVGEAEQV
ncbi:hypothetical protein [Streptomyces sp. bgisy060]|uniref:hypothetical protein n=1 Tax=Streptomyces sp. bgisy060 TaxID=3413775 RepID=UPI003EB93C79